MPWAKVLYLVTSSDNRLSVREPPPHHQQQHSLTPVQTLALACSRDVQTSNQKL